MYSLSSDLCYSWGLRKTCTAQRSLLPAMFDPFQARKVFSTWILVGGWQQKNAYFTRRALDFSLVVSSTLVLHHYQQEQGWPDLTPFWALLPAFPVSYSSIKYLEFAKWSFQFFISPCLAFSYTNKSRNLTVMGHERRLWPRLVIWLHCRFICWPAFFIDGPIAPCASSK